ncbi:DMT family transporter [Peptoniphilus sp. KCTC 25270]|uniref:DMT family transporter n=1 Tax=Peptoniphilus sp. KCTC 25270 TaxID=2897414 RepID=UPI001E41D931|nr:DMT family transporter [Peptoniphilus sp. KCTC 25270]MCD1147384.1 DMT family transporter [Peptoniphilus sp. KCTC 25270]
MNQRKADLMLLFITITWGFSFLLTDIALKEFSPFFLNAFRFLVGFSVIFLTQFKHMKNPSSTTILYSILTGTVLFCVYLGATFGVKYTTLTNAGFLSCITVILVPIFSQLVYRRPVPSRAWIVVVVATIGIALMTLDENFSINPKNLKGDLLCLFCAASYANHLLITEKAVAIPTVDPLQLGTYQIIVCSILNLICSFIFETPALPSSSTVWMAVLFLAVFCTGISFVVQPIAQQFTTATHVGVIYTLEPVIAGLLAWFVVGEAFNLRKLIGAIILVLSILVMELTPSKKAPLDQDLEL